MSAHTEQGGSTTREFDVVIVGAGLVGATLAAAIGKRCRLLLVDPQPFNCSTQPSYDDRATALSFSSRQIYQQLDLWSQLAQEAEPIQLIHVSRRGWFGATRLSAAEEGVEALGYVVENRTLGRLLHAHLEGVEQAIPSRIDQVEQEEEGVTFRVISEGAAPYRARAQIMLVADGTASQTRQALGIDVLREQYDQVGIVSNVSSETPHRGWAFERFTPWGPVALLPLPRGRSSLVWCAPADEAERLLLLDKKGFLAHLQEWFGYRLGRFTQVGARVAYPLARVQAKPQSKDRILLIGNAANTVHPVAGQGFNLALRDVAGIASLLTEAIEQDALTTAPAVRHLIEQFLATRQRDRKRVLATTDLLARLPTSRSVGSLPFGLALGVADSCPRLRHWIARAGMGMGG